MPVDDSLSRKTRQLAAIGLAALLWLVYLGLSPLWMQEPADPAFSTPVGKAALVLFGLLILSSLGTLVAGLLNLAPLQRLAGRARLFAWPLSVLLLGLLAWIFLFSPLQAQLNIAWAQLLIALGLARLLAWLFNPAQDRLFGWEELALAIALFIFPRVVQEARIIHPTAVLWISALVGMAVLVEILIGLLYGRSRNALRSRLLAFRLRLGPGRIWLGVLVFFIPLFYRYALGSGGYILYPNIRFAMLAVTLALAAFLLCTSVERIISIRSIAEASGWLVLVSALTQALLLVVNNPFSLSWSEGNRFYDYSLIFGQHLYDYPGTIFNPYNSPGRYSLWGVMFLWQGLPIWAHRLWNVALLFLPSLLLAWILTRKLTTPWRTVLFLWVSAFFIIIAPLHPPFMLVLIIVAAFALHPSPFVRGASLVAASLYASLSRWTWILAPGAWGALIDLFLYYPNRKGNWFQRLLPTIGMTLLGAGPGLLVQAGYLREFSSGEALTSNQPLLWYRLFPNTTLGPGILLLMAYTTGPLVALLIFQAASRRWKVDLFQSLALWGALAGFLAAGLVISTKIGGGGDLHNLDMYIGTLILCTMLSLHAGPASRAGASPVKGMASLPTWTWALLLLLVFQQVYPFTPFNPLAGYNKWLDLPSGGEASQVLERIRTEVNSASRRGEVLFMDQRQLLTFGYIQGVPFVPEYEKKYMMDQAMAANAAYFLPYYRDLQKHRFTLIVTEPLKVNLKNEDEGVFSEENDAWVVWVSAPTLCFYEPIMTEKSVGVQLLVPRQDAKDCGKYLQQAEP